MAKKTFNIYRPSGDRGRLVASILATSEAVARVRLEARRGVPTPPHWLVLDAAKVIGTPKIQRKAEDAPTPCPTDEEMLDAAIDIQMALAKDFQWALRMPGASWPDMIKECDRLVDQAGNMKGCLRDTVDENAKLKADLETTQRHAEDRMLIIHDQDRILREQAGRIIEAKESLAVYKRQDHLVREALDLREGEGALEAIAAMRGKLADLQAIYRVAELIPDWDACQMESAIRSVLDREDMLSPCA